MFAYFSLFLIISPHVNPKINEDFYLSKSVRAMSLQLKVLDHLPYLQFSQLCHSQVLQHNYGYNLSIWSKGEDTQFENVKNSNQNLDLAVLVDTGSNQFWLADRTCANCKKTQSICPQMSQADKKIKYMKGYVEGIDSYISLCENRIKFLCVKQVFGVGELNANGILGLREDSLGIDMIFRILKKKGNVVTKNDIIEQDYRRKKDKYQQLEHSSITISFFAQRGEILAKKILIIRQKQSKDIEKTIARSTYIQSNQNWQINVTGLIICQQSLLLADDLESKENTNNLITASVDTGSSRIVLSDKLCALFIESMKKNKGIKCKYHQGEGVDCSTIIQNVDFQIELTREEQKISLTVHQSDILDPFTNRLGFVCQPSFRQRDYFMILGYPFIKNYRTALITEKTRQDAFDQESKIEKKVWIEIEKIERGQYEKRKRKTVKSILFLYAVLVFVLSWCCLVGLDYVRDKRSKKIII